MMKLNNEIKDDRQQTPCVGKWFSPYENSCVLASRMVKEDEEFFYFHNGIKYPKVHSFCWFETTEPKEMEQIESTKFPYESYSLLSRQLAKALTIEELRKELNRCEALTIIYAEQHLKAIEATTSMQSQSQRRAQAGNNVTGNYERKQMYKNAIELHELYPEQHEN